MVISRKVTVCGESNSQCCDFLSFHLKMLRIAVDHA